MATTTSQSCKRCESAHKLVSFLFDQTVCKKCERETVPKPPVMPRDIFDASFKGDNNMLIERLGLQTKEQTKIQKDGDSDREISQSTNGHPFGSELMPPAQRISHFVTQSNVTVRSELQSATRSGDTVLHLLVTKMHNELALMVFERDPSLLKMQNKMLETPLHCAAKVGNQEVILKFIDIEPAIVKDALQETNEKGDTVLHVAVRYNCADICCKLMRFDSEIAYHVNKEMFSPFHIAIDKEYDSVAEKMLCVDPVLACTQLTDGMFPVHIAALKYNWSMVFYFIKYFPDYAELVDSRGRNPFHIYAEEVDSDHTYFELSSEFEDTMTQMNNATDYEGNTPLHIAAMKGHRGTMRFILNYMTNCVAETVKNKRGLTPYEVSRNQLTEVRGLTPNKPSKVSWTTKDFSIYRRIKVSERTNGEKFSPEWFADIMVPPSLKNRWERTQVIGLGSALITTVTFAAAFTIPGGYNQDHGTLVLGRRYMFWAFILANTLAFMQGFLSLFSLLLDALPGLPLDTFEFAATFFLLAATSMVMAFGLGLYVTLAPACLPIAIIILVLTLLTGSPALFLVFLRKKDDAVIVGFLRKWEAIILAFYTFSILFIFCLALLSR